MARSNQASAPLTRFVLSLLHDFVTCLLLLIRGIIGLLLASVGSVFCLCASFLDLMLLIWTGGQGAESWLVDSLEVVNLSQR